jgi:hypothetical protein
VGSAPPRLDLGAAPGSFPELCEVLQLGLERLAEDRTPALPPVVGARRRALQIMAARLGLGREADLTPAWLLRPGNLAMGAVVVDAEAAVEAMHKLLVVGDFGDAALTSQTLDPGQRSRAAAPGNRSVLAVAVPLPAGTGRAVAAVVAEVLGTRAAGAFAEGEVEVLSPHVPGRPTLVLLVTAEGRLDELEERVRSAWSRVTAPVTEAELETVRRQTAARLTAAASGSIGHAQGCAQLAAGVWPWQAPTELEMAVLTLEVDQVGVVLAGARGFETLETTGAGVLPISTAVQED